MISSKKFKPLPFIFILILILPLWLSSCSRYSKEDYFTEYNQFITQIEAEYTQYDKCKWDETELEYNKYNNELYDKVYSELNQEDQKQIGKLKARYQKVKYEYEIKNTIQTIKDGIQQTVGAIESVLDSTVNK